MGALICGLVAALPSAPVVFAEETTRIPTVVVEGEDEEKGAGIGEVSRSTQSVEDSTGFVDVVLTESAWRGFDSVADILSHSVGTRVRSFGGREDFATVSVRGSRAGQVKILLDGVSLSRAQNGVVNLSNLPLDSLERIEAYRGFTPASFASAGSGHVVNLITRKPEKEEVGISASVGSFGTGKVSLHAASPTEDGVVSGFATVRTTDGDFDFQAQGMDLQGNQDDFVATNINNASDSADLLLRYASNEADRWGYTLRSETFWKREGVPGGVVPGADTQSPESDLRTFREVVSAAITSPSRDWRIEADFTGIDERFRNPFLVRDFKKISLDVPFTLAENRTYAGSLSLGWSRALGDLHFLQAGVQTGYEVFRGRTEQEIGGFAQVFKVRDERNTLGIVLADEIVWDPWDLTLNLQLRHDRLWNRFEPDPLLPGGQANGGLPEANADSTNPRGGFRWDPSDWVSLKGNIGSYFRAPNFGELFGDSGFANANLALEPEEGLTRDIGIALTWDSPGTQRRLDFEYAYFANEIDNAIVIIQTGSRRAQAENVASARITGHEFRLFAAPAKGWTVEANYTHQDPRNRTDKQGLKNKKLPSVPPDEVYARLGYSYGSWAVGYEFSFVTDHFTDVENSGGEGFFIGDRAAHNAALTFGPFGGGFALRFEVENIGDTLTADVYGFPTPGRAWYLTVSHDGGS